MNKQTKIYINNLLSNKQKLQYLLDRGLTLDSIKKFGIGLSLSKQVELNNLSINKHKNIKNTLLGKADNKFYPFFSNRIMIPFKSVNGRKIIGYTARDIYSIDNKYLTKDEVGIKSYFKEQNIDLAKYKNSIESDTFKKSEYLYNLNGITSSSAIVFEAQLNTVACDQLQSQGVKFDLDGIDTIPHPVATGGTSLTEKHIDLLIVNGVMNVILCYDGDRAGIKATKRAIEMLLKRKELISISVISMPKNTDLMDLIKESEKVKKLVSKIRFAEQWLCDFYEYQEKAFEKKLTRIDKINICSVEDYNHITRESNKYNVHNLYREFENTINFISVNYSQVNGDSVFHNHLNRKVA